MKFGTSIVGLVQHPVDQPLDERFEEVLAWVRAARDLGVDYLVAGQHFLTDPYQELQPLPLLARLVPESGDMNLVATLIAPLHNPVELAESWASLDIISGGRLGLSLALGYRDEEYAAFGVDPRRRVRVFREVVEILLALWQGKRVTWQGERFALADARCLVQPLQKPHPPVWIAANADKAVERAARWGLDWNINAHATGATIERQVAVYRAARDAATAAVGLPMGRELYCAPTREEAFAQAAPYLGGKYMTYERWGQDEALPEGDRFSAQFEELARDRFIIGDPDDCAREIERYRRLGVDRMHFRSIWPGMPLEPALDGFRLFLAEVAPRFRDY